MSICPSSIYMWAHLGTIGRLGPHILRTAAILSMCYAWPYGCTHSFVCSTAIYTAVDGFNVNVHSKAIQSVCRAQQHSPNVHLPLLNIHVGTIGRLGPHRLRTAVKLAILSMGYAQDGCMGVWVYTHTAMQKQSHTDFNMPPPLQNYQARRPPKSCFDCVNAKHTPHSIATLCHSQLHATKCAVYI